MAPPPPDAGPSSKQLKQPSQAWSTIKLAYLVGYNSLQAGGWAACLWLLARYWAPDAFDETFSSAAPVVEIFQLVAGIEILHALTGIVPSSPILALMQWAGRSNVLFLVVGGVREVHSSPFAPLMLAAWALAEVVRYPWYALTLMGVCPKALTWLRYTLFIVIYPIGVVSEMVLMWQALPTLTTKHMYSLDMPNAINFTFHYSTFLMIILAVYPLLWWQLYSSLLSQRRKKLRASDKGKKQE